MPEMARKVPDALPDYGINLTDEQKYKVVTDILQREIDQINEIYTRQGAKTRAHLRIFDSTEDLKKFAEESGKEDDIIIHTHGVIGDTGLHIGNQQVKWDDKGLIDAMKSFRGHAQNLALYACFTSWDRALSLIDWTGVKNFYFNQGVDIRERGNFGLVKHYDDKKAMVPTRLEFDPSSADARAQKMSVVIQGDLEIDKILKEVRVWTGANGKVEAQILSVGADGKTATFRTKQGQTVTTAVTNLSQEDRALISRIQNFTKRKGSR